MFIQQGDVLLKKISSLPNGLTKQVRKSVGGKQPRFILAEGEVTGHAHAICEDVDLFKSEDGKLFLKNDSPISIEHEEHKHISNLPAGIWEIGIVQEYDHFAEEARNVAD